MRSLGGLLSAGLTAHLALHSWHEEESGTLRIPLERVARRLALGGEVGDAMSALRGVLDEDASGLAAIFSIHGRLGGDAAGMVAALASSVERRRHLEAAARAAAAGAKLSGRVVASLPVLLLPAMPLARAPLFDAVGLALLFLGLVLAAAGIVWIEKLVPAPPRHDDGVALATELVASGLRAGVGLSAALEVVAAHAPADIAAELQRAQRRTRLGMSWTQSLDRAGDERLGSAAAAIRRAHRAGLPVADALEGCARALRDERERAFEAALRRAPVLMVVPLTLCVLPSFILLGVAPFLRGIALR